MSTLGKSDRACCQEMLGSAFKKAWLYYVMYGVIKTTNYICLWTK